MRKQSLQFGPFAFDVTRSLLFRDGVHKRLGRRGTALLGALLARRGEVLSKSDLMEAAWPGTFVEEANLSVQIAQLRKVLGRNTEGREWIATVQRIGYRFLPTIEAGIATPRIPTLAVLPFTDFGTGAQSEADGFVDDLTTALSKFKSIAVVARHASFQRRERSVDSRQFAELWGAGYVVEGSLRRVGARLRANIQLIDGVTGSHLWAEMFDVATTDDIVGHIAGVVEPKIASAEIARSRAERPDGTSPYDLYLQARRLLRSSTEADNAAAYWLLRRALQAAPENIHILAAAGEALHHRVAVGLPALTLDDRKETLDLARRGLALGIDDAAALGSFSHSLFVAREWDLARSTMERAVETNPYDTRALTCAGQGALFLGSNKAAEYYQRALAFGPSDPNRHFTLNGLAVIERRRGNYENAIQLAKSAVAICPGFSGSHWQLITATAYAGRREEALAHLARYRAVAPGATLTSIGTGQPIVDERLLNHLIEGLAEAGLPEA